MKKKEIKKLVLHSYKNNVLDETKVEKIVQFLSRSDCKRYLRFLKQYENSISVSVFLPFPPTQKQKETIKAIFKDKKITYQIDKSLLSGMRIIQNDTIIEYNIKHTLGELVHYVAR